MAELARLKRERAGLMDQVAVIDEKAKELLTAMVQATQLAVEGWPHVDPEAGPMRGTFVRALSDGGQQRRLDNGRLVNYHPDGTITEAVRDSPQA